jgi:hypothetical protein
MSLSDDPRRPLGNFVAPTACSPLAATKFRWWRRSQLDAHADLQGLIDGQLEQVDRAGGVA